MERKAKQIIWISALLLLVLLLWHPGAGLAQSPENQNSDTLYVSVNTGQDTASCGTQAQPCASIQYAAQKAASGQTIRVAAGVYTFNAAYDTCSAALGTTAVVCIRNKNLTLLGGFTPNNWNNANPTANLTIIDGQNSYRGILIQSGMHLSPSVVTFDGFMVRNGRVQGASSGTNPEIAAFGGGLLSDFSVTILRRMDFRNNQAIGGGANNSFGGAASGGAVALRSGRAGTRLENITFTNNQAIGGNGQERGGFGIGGALYLFSTVANGQNITASGNSARGGHADGSGLVNGENADAQGGAIAVQRDSAAQFQNITLINNQAIGGNAPNGQGGGAFGGGFFAETASFTIIDGLIQNNVAQGGNGRNASAGGSVAAGGGIGSDQTTVVLERVRVINNRASGGNGAIISGTGEGGGGAFVRKSGDSTVLIVNSIFADNLAEIGSTGNATGGGGGGISLRGTAATIQHATIARNRLGAAPMQGNGVLLLNDGSSTNSVATIANTILANHTAYNGAIALHVKPGNTANLQRVLLDGNNTNTGGGGTINGMGSVISGAVNFKSPGAPNYDYSLTLNSAARDASTNSTLPIDIVKEPRDDRPDLGAYEYQKPAITAVYGVPTVSNQVFVHWQTVNMSEALGYYELTVSCPPGGAAPVGITCGAPINLGVQTARTLDGLTNHIPYGVTVRAFSPTGTLLCEKSISITAMDTFLYLPLITQ